MSIRTEVLADSVAPSGVRLTTYRLCYPARIHWDVLTHRALSRNASSTRAIPLQKMISWVESDPFIPDWTWNEKGMQGRPLDDPEVQAKAEDVWHRALKHAVHAVSELQQLGIHKQDANPLLIPFMHMNVVATADQFGWANFFHLRTDAGANRTFQALARSMAEDYLKSSPIERPAPTGDGGSHDHRPWHLPFIFDLERAHFPVNQLRVVSVARCARVSHKTFDGRVASFDEDLALYRDKLADTDPMHASPLEHVAVASASPNLRSGNFQGWVQFRKLHHKEWCREFDFRRLEEAS